MGKSYPKQMATHNKEFFGCCKESKPERILVRDEVRNKTYVLVRENGKLQKINEVSFAEKGNGGKTTGNGEEETLPRNEVMYGGMGKWLFRSTMYRRLKDN